MADETPVVVAKQQQPTIVAKSIPAPTVQEMPMAAPPSDVLLVLNTVNPKMVASRRITIGDQILGCEVSQPSLTFTLSGPVTVTIEDLDVNEGVTATNVLNLTPADIDVSPWVSSLPEPNLVQPIIVPQ